ncbi:Reverse transcriptase zinc-binding domain [Macleaya cordata]|uniref:Reverse transcriptase zinc-binding domain n=1 Tax=Macleaya cordata TaxID=56857 RepID=A0A200R1H4_MACCD|nr:Reverse transcriptase zinc-binding domain [Macleaya cordata]
MGRMGMAGILSKVGDGRRIKFWHDNWLTETPLTDRFKSLFRVSRKKNESVCDFLTIDEEGRLEWDLDLPRRLGDTEATEFTELQMLLSSYVLNEGEDGRSWRWEKNGSFTVRSCYDAIHTGGSDSFSHANIWNKTVPTKISFFIWVYILLLRSGQHPLEVSTILNMLDNLERAERQILQQQGERIRQDNIGGEGHPTILARPNQTVKGCRLLPTVGNFYRNSTYIGGARQVLRWASMTAPESYLSCHRRFFSGYYVSARSVGLSGDLQWVLR